MPLWIVPPPLTWTVPFGPITPLFGPFGVLTTTFSPGFVDCPPPMLLTLFGPQVSAMIVSHQIDTKLCRGQPPAFTLSQSISFRW